MKRKFDIKKRIVLSVLAILIVACGGKTGHNHIPIGKRNLSKKEE